MVMRKIKKGDSVIIIAGKDKDRQGVVLKVLSPRRHPGDFKVVVEGINLVKRHVKPDPKQERPGGIVQQEAPISISNVAIFNVAAEKRDRVGFKILEDGRKVRIFKSTGERIDE
jgi:large subunit ribosomal protein L24